jgi:hypothetical protein
MTAWPEPASFHDPLPKTMKHCKTCDRETPHEIRGGPGLSAIICIACLRRALMYELEKD